MHNLMIAVTLWWGVCGLQEPLEKQALSVVQRVSVAKLDTALPGSPFAAWFEQLVGRRSEVVWQLSECGQQPIDSAIASTQQGHDMDIPACVEANAVLSDGRKVAVMIRVGSFKRGITGRPGFNFAVIEQEGELYLIKRLSDLPGRIRKQLVPAAETARRLSWPEVETANRLLKFNRLAPILPEGLENGPIPGASVEADHPPPPPLPPPPPETLTLGDSSNSDSTPDTSESDQRSEAPEIVSWGDAIIKVQPRYPSAAKKVNASGTVDVRITISELGRVVGAKAIRGHPLLQKAAEEAARQWVFKPATLKGTPVVTQIILNFAFRAPE